MLSVISNTSVILSNRCLSEAIVRDNKSVLSAS